MLNQTKKRKKIAVYARVSTEHEAQLNAIENQKQWYLDIINRHDEWDFVEMYADEGITGTSATKRPEFMRMIGDALNGKFELIITREVSRFARNTVDTLEYVRQLKRKGVEVYFINDSIKTFDPDGELRLTIMASLAQEESRKTSGRVKAGQKISMQNGVLYGNGNILGYDFVKKVRDGNKIDREIVINEEQAKVVRLIFQLYLSGKGTQAIKYELENRGIKTASGKDIWHSATISRILRNSFYCGLIQYNKQYVPDYLEQKKINNLGEIEAIVVEGNHPTIISKEEYYAVQRRLENACRECKSDRGKRRSGKRPKPDVWAKLLFCECGHEFSRQKWHKTDAGIQYGYICYNAIRTGSVNSRKKRGLSTEGICDAKMISGWKMEMMAMKIFKRNLLDTGDAVELAKKMIADHQSQTQTISDEKDEESRKAIEKEIQSLEKKMDALLDLLLEDTIDKSQYQNKKMMIQQQLQKLKSNLAEKTEKNSSVTQTRQKKIDLEQLYHILDEYVLFEKYEEKIPESIIDAFVEKIIVHKDSFDWYLRRSSKYKNISEDPIEVASFDITKEDAYEYVRSLKKDRRILKWQDLKVKVYY